MALERIGDLDLGRVAGAAERALRAVRLRHRHEEVVESQQRALDRFTRREVTVAVVRRGARRPGAAPPPPRATRVRRRPTGSGVPSAGPRGWRCPSGRRSPSGTWRTGPRSTPPQPWRRRRRCRVRLPARRRIALVADLGLQVVHERDDRPDVRIGQRRRDHLRAGPAVLDDRQHQLAGLVVEREFRAQQVGPAELAAACIDAVTGTARPGKEASASLDELRVTLRPLLRGEPPTALAARTGRPESVPAGSRAAGWPGGGGPPCPSITGGCGGGCAGACCGPSLVARTVTERATPSAAAATHDHPALMCASLPVPGQGCAGLT